MTPVRQTGESVLVTVNGRDRELPAGTTVAQLLHGLGIDPRRVVVEVNREILRDAALHDQHEFGSGDTVEIVHFVGGG